MTGIDLAIAPAAIASGGVVAVVYIGYSVITVAVDYYTAVQIFKDKEKEQQIANGAFAKCLNRCRWSCPENDDEAIQFFNDFKWK